MYATVDAMRRKFGDSELIQLTDNEAPYLNAINMDKLNGAMQEANSEIDAYVGSRYALPLHIIPPFFFFFISNTGVQDLIFLAICSPRFLAENYVSA